MADCHHNSFGNCFLVRHWEPHSEPASDKNTFSGQTLFTWPPWITFLISLVAGDCLSLCQYRTNFKNCCPHQSLQHGNMWKELKLPFTKQKIHCRERSLIWKRDYVERCNRYLWSDRVKPNILLRSLPPQLPIRSHNEMHTRICINCEQRSSLQWSIRHWELKRSTLSEMWTKKTKMTRTINQSNKISGVYFLEGGMQQF